MLAVVEYDCASIRHIETDRRQMSHWMTVTGSKVASNLIGHGDTLPEFLRHVLDLYTASFPLREYLSAVHSSPFPTQHVCMILLHDAGPPCEDGRIVPSDLAALRRSGVVRVLRRPYGSEGLRLQGRWGMTRRACWHTIKKG